jgi:hypothetical protein
VERVERLSRAPDAWAASTPTGGAGKPIWARSPQPGPLAPCEQRRRLQGPTKSFQFMKNSFGKRDVRHGRVRIRSYVVVETPINEQVNLRNESV